jgi:hypothetical protein
LQNNLERNAQKFNGWNEFVEFVEFMEFVELKELHELLPLTNSPLLFVGRTGALASIMLSTAPTNQHSRSQPPMKKLNSMNSTNSINSKNSFKANARGQEPRPKLHTTFQRRVLSELSRIHLS